MGNKAGHEKFVTKVQSVPGRGRSGTIILKPSSEKDDEKDVKSSHNNDVNPWKPLRRNGTVIYTYDNEKNENSYILSLKVGEKVEIFEESENWYRGAVLSIPPRNGIFPSAYIKLDEHIPNDRERTNSQKSDIMLRLEEIRKKKILLQEQMAQLKTPNSHEILKSNTKKLDESQINNNEAVNYADKNAINTKQINDNYNNVSNSKSYDINNKTSNIKNNELSVENDIKESFDIMAGDMNSVSVDEVCELLPSLIDYISDTDIKNFIEATEDPLGQIKRDKYYKVMTKFGWLSDATKAAVKTGLSNQYNNRQNKLSDMLSGAEKVYATEDSLDILDVMDPERKGYVHTLELLEVIDEIVTGGEIGDVQLERMLVEADPNGSGRISRLQFLKMMKMCLEPPPVKYDKHIPIFSRKRTNTSLSL